MSRSDRGSVLVLAMLVLVAITFIALTLARDAKVEIQVAARAVDDVRTRALADSCIEKMICYLKQDLQNATSQAAVADTLTKQWRYDESDLRNFAIGDANAEGSGHGWIFFGEEDPGDGYPFKYGIRDEASKLNVNTASLNQLLALQTNASGQLLPMTNDIATAILNWRSSGQNAPQATGAQNDTYNTLTPAYSMKAGPIETLEEMLGVYGVDASVLYGEDRNRNGLLDPCENDGSSSYPPDDSDGNLQLGLADYLTTTSQDLDVTWDGRLRMYVGARQGSNSPAAAADIETRLTQHGCTAQAAQQVGRTVGRTGVPSIGQFLSIRGMTQNDLAVIGDELTVHVPATAGQLGQIPGRINVNTAAAQVLAGLPDTRGNAALSVNDVQAIQTYRVSGADDLWSPAWLLPVIGAQKLGMIWDMITCRSWQFTIQAVVALDLPADVRPMRRIEVVIDRSYIPMRILWRRDTTNLGFPIPSERGDKLP